MTDPYDLNRFVEAQDRVYAGAVDQLRRGRKTGHWIWFVFPQMAGLGHSSMSRRYSIASLPEARAYRAHPVLGPRLVECTKLVLAASDRPVAQVLGQLDALKFRSCMTLFSIADPDNGLFQAALDRCFEGRPDPLTLAMLQGD